MRARWIKEIRMDEKFAWSTCTQNLRAHQLQNWIPIPLHTTSKALRFSWSQLLICGWSRPQVGIYISRKKYKYFRYKSIIAQEPTFQIKKSFQRGVEISMPPTLKQRPAKVIYVQRPPLAQLPLQLTPLSQSTQCTFTPFDKSLFTKSKFACNLDTWRTSLMRIFFVFFFHHHLNNNSIYSNGFYNIIITYMHIV